MTINMENYNNISSHTGQYQFWHWIKNEWLSVWRITTIWVSDNGQDKTEQHNQYGELQQYQFSLWTRQNYRTISMENCNINSDTGQDKNEWESVGRITTISVLTLDKIKTKGNQYKELQY